jgi:hypothetical protein
MEDRTLLSAANQALVAQMYQDLLQRPADSGGLANWSAMLDQGSSATQVALELAQSTEGRGLQVHSLYQQFLHREGDSAGLDAFTRALTAGQTLEQVATTMAASTEYYQSRSGGSDSSFLDALYQDALSRPVDASGAASFGQALAGGTTRARVAETIFSSLELRHDMVRHDYESLLHRVAETDGLEHWAQALQRGARDEQIAAAIAGSAEYVQTISGTNGLQPPVQPADGVGLPVIVTNTVPVTAQQSGVWTVGISGTPTVNVASSASSPVFVRNVNDVQPFQLTSGSFSFTADSAHSSFTVPSNKRLVIEYVSGEVLVPTGQKVLDVFLLAAGDYGYMTLTVNGTDSSGHDFATFSQPMTMYADAGSNVVLGAERSSTVGIASIQCMVSGYLVDV